MIQSWENLVTDGQTDENKNNDRNIESTVIVTGNM